MVFLKFFITNAQFFAYKLATIGAEAMLFYFVLKRAYPWRSCATSLYLRFGYSVIEALTGFVLPLYLFRPIFDRRFFDLSPGQWWYYPLLFIGYELCYYWHHRACHEIRFFWASHHLHHSAEELNIASAARITWSPFGGFTSIFFIPLFLMGFAPLQVILYGKFHIFLMTWVHLDYVPKIRFLEGRTNTPSAHRVHHATQPEYLNRNYGGILMLWDHVFGTYTPENDERPPVIGLVEPVRSHNPFVIGFYEWRALLRDLRRATGWKSRGKVLLGRPGAEVA